MKKSTEPLKIVFLDIDGVLNGNSNKIMAWVAFKSGSRVLYKLFSHFYPRYKEDLYSIHEDKVARLAKIVHSTNAKIVLISSWRDRVLKAFVNKDMREKYPNQEFTILYNLFKKYNLSIYDVAPHDQLGYRSSEIAMWLDKCKSPIYSFVVLDDEVNDEFIDRQIITCDYPEKAGYWDTLDGLRDKHVGPAIKLLNKKLDSKNKYTNILGGYI